MRDIELDLILSVPQGNAGKLAREAVARWREGDTDAGQRAFTAAFQMSSEYASTWSTLGVFALLRGDSATARKLFRQASLRSPDLVDPIHNDAVALLAMGRGDEAIAKLHDALAVASDDSRVWLSLARLLRGKGNLAGAISAAQRAAEQLPDRSRAALELAQLFRAAGDPVATRRHAQAAVAAATQLLPAKLVENSRRSPFSREAAHDALRDAHDVLTAAQMTFFPIAGTLLGLIREGEVLAHDKDMDLGLPFETDREAVIAAFSAHPAFVVPPVPRAPEQTLWAFGVKHQAVNCAIDLFFVRDEGANFTMGFNQSPHPILSRVQPFGLRAMHWLDRDWQIPDPPERYLEQIYGPGWRLPDPHYDTVLSNPCRLPQSLPLAINLGLIRLAHALRAHSWARAESLCRQLLARESIPEITELLAALSARLPAAT